MKIASSSAPSWAVSTHTDGEVLTAGVTGDHADLVLLGIPVGFTAAEIEGWLRDLAGVAFETSTTDARQRAIPSLLHHTLTGLLFSHAELWTRGDDPVPCSAVFIDTPDGASFGWVGEANARVRIEGRDYSPQWVIVRDEEGREARAAMLPPGVRAEVSVEHWPGGRDSGHAPITVEAEWGASALTDSAPSTDPAPLTAASPEAPAEAAAAMPMVLELEHLAAAPIAELPPLPESLPVGQPSLMASGADAVSSQTHVETSPQPPIASTIEPLESIAPAESGFAREPAVAPPRSHPVARWLGRLMQWGRKDETIEEAATEAVSAPTEVAPAPAPALVPEAAPTASPESPGDAPVSQYDLLLTTPEEDLAPEMQVVEPGDAAASIPEWSEASASLPPPPAPEIEPQSVTPESPTAFAPHHEETPPAIEPSAPAAAADRPTLAPAGFEDILGRGRSSEPPNPLSPQPVAPRAHTEMPSDATVLPKLSVPLPPESTDLPIHVEHEPIGAHSEQFDIAPLPADRRLGLSRPTLEDPLANEDPHAALLDLPWLEPSHDRDRSVRVPGEPVVSRRAWPAPDEESRLRPRVSPAMIGLGAALVILFGAGWLVGSWQGQRAGEPSMADRLLRSVGLGAPRFTAEMETQPPGAWISVDGRELQRRTPASIELSPGDHQVTFSMPDLGEHVVTVSGRKGESVRVNESLHGTLEVIPSDTSVPIQVSVDRQPLGYAPISVESIEPGLHEVMFSGPGMPAWAQTVQVGIRRTAQVVAHPMTSPATGVLQVQASLDDSQGSSPLSGAQVFVDGEMKGVTPLSVEMARGPHSIRVHWRGETAPVQVIDLPGGNQRFAMFAFGLDMDQPILKPLSLPRSIDATEPTTVSAALDGMSANVVREAWLHVRTSEGLWRRSSMSVMRAPKGVVLSAVFPFNTLEGQTQTRWYMSALTLQGDEYFTEMQRVQVSNSTPRRTAASDPP